MIMRRKCRVWWPKELSSSKVSSSHIMFGWFFSCSPDSLDVVVALACDEVALSRCQSGIEGILHNTDDNMPVFLQNKSMFSILGQCATDLSSNGPPLRVGIVEDDKIKLPTGCSAWAHNGPDIFRENCEQRSCGCRKFGGILEECRQASIESRNWIQLVYDSYEHCGRDIRGIPKFRHIHWNRQIVSECDVHFVVYEMPKYGAHHFSRSLWKYSSPTTASLKKPRWVNELYQKQQLIDLEETVILAINSAASAKMFFERHVAQRRSSVKFSVVCMFLAFTWQIIAMSIASLSSIWYVILQFLHSLWSYSSQSWICMTSTKIFRTTWINIRIRCCQILYWPVFLQDNGLRFRSCVEYAEEAALQKHSMWSSLFVDALLGNLIGLAMLYNVDSACLWISNFANEITNKMLRSGCVWLMGVPAGFKLNTELAGVLGMISLNAIQIWSTLWIFVGFLFIYFVKGLSILGILFGATVPAALIIDVIRLTTLHVSTLHWWISHVYSLQIQALAALWRLFRGRKWNPLRQRLDSYDYSVEQHIVGSLMFTPLLLLLPTTSVFYMFFSIMNTSVSLICMLIEVTISVIHATPYIKIFLWLVTPRRFPSGIWFEIVTCWSETIDVSEVVCHNEFGSSSKISVGNKDISGKKSNVLVSLLHSNSLSIGRIVLPHYRKVFSGVSGSFVATSAHGVLTGKRIPSTLGTGLPPKLPWMVIPYKAYWCLCRDAVLACSDYHVNASSPPNGLT